MRRHRCNRILAVGVGMTFLVAATGCESGVPDRPEVPSSGLGCSGRPYAASSSWNTPISPTAGTEPMSTAYLNTLTATGHSLTSDVDQYTIALYCTTPKAPRRSVQFSGYYSDYLTGVRVGHGQTPLVNDLPLPTGITAPTGTDAQVVIWDPAAGIEYGFWQFAWNNGKPTATNGYATRTDASSAGRFADGLAGRGAGLPYLGGLVRPNEITAGHIDHALAFAYPFPSHEHVFPASKSDGKGIAGHDLPEGTRLQLDPTLTSADLTKLGVNASGLVIAKALQTYGMYVVDNSGSAKVYLQDRTTAGWNATINRQTLGKIPWTTFKVVRAPL